MCGFPRPLAFAGCLLLLLLPSSPSAQEAPPSTAPETGFDAALAERLGADERGMRSYVLVILRTGPERVPDGDARRAMFAGHFANMQRLSDAGKLVLAGPFSADPAGWRGLFLLAVDDVDEARRLTETDPVIVNGEMVAEYHPWYGSAAAMMLPEIHARIVPEGPLKGPVVRPTSGTRGDAPGRHNPVPSVRPITIREPLSCSAACSCCACR